VCCRLGRSPSCGAQQQALEPRAGDGAAPLHFPLYLLGQDASGRFTLAVDVSGPGDEQAGARSPQRQRSSGRPAAARTLSRPGAPASCRAQGAASARPTHWFRPRSPPAVQASRHSLSFSMAPATWMCRCATCAWCCRCSPWTLWPSQAKPVRCQPGTRQVDRL